MLIEDIIHKLQSKTGPVILDMMRKQLSVARGGNRYAHHTTGATANSIEPQRARNIGGDLLWEVRAADSAIRLDTGGSAKMGVRPKDAPYGQFREKMSDGGKPSDYITALIEYVRRKHGLSGLAAKKAAFAMAQAAANRKPQRTVKNPGWFSEIEARITKQISSDLSSLIMMELNKKINKELKGNK